MINFGLATAIIGGSAIGIEIISLIIKKKRKSKIEKEKWDKKCKSLSKINLSQLKNIVDNQYETAIKEKNISSGERKIIREKLYEENIKKFIEL